VCHIVQRSDVEFNGTAPGWLVDAKDEQRELSC
jgi:hypothetical protein